MRCLAAFLCAALGCGGGAASSDAELPLPAGDPDGGTVKGTITTDLTDTTGGLFYLGAFADADAGVPLVAIGVGEVTFPYAYQLDDIPGGERIIRALLDLPPYAARPLVDPPGAEDATGVWLNSSSVAPVFVRPGAITDCISFFVTRLR